jgi:MFS family permease
MKNLLVMITQDPLSTHWFLVFVTLFCFLKELILKQLHQKRISNAVFSEPLRLVFVCAFLFFTSYHFLTPIVPLYLEKLKLSGQSIGLIISALMAGSIAMRPFAGKMTDELSNTRLMLLSAVLFSIAPLGFVFFKAPSVLILLRLLQGACYALFYTASTGLVLQYVPQARRTEGISHFSNSMKLAIALSPLLAGWLEYNLGLEMTFLMACALGTLCTLAILYTGHYTRQSIHKKRLAHHITQAKSPVVHQVKGRLFNKHGVLPGLVMASNSAVFGALIPFAAILGHSKGFAEAGGLFYTIYGFSLIFSRSFVGKLADEMGYHVILLPGMFLVFLSVIGIIFSSSPLLFWGFAGLYGFAAGTVQPSLMAVAADQAPSREYGSTLATFSMINDVGIAIGSFLMGLVGHELGYNWALAMVALLLIIGITFYHMKYKSHIPAFIVWNHRKSA